MPDFGSFRGFGEKLTQGQTPTQLGMIGSLTFAYDPDAVLFFDRVTIAGGTLSIKEKEATSNLVIDLKNYGIWSAMKAVYPMVGASAAACAQNLKSSSFTGTFSSGWTFAITGVTPNGTSAYFDTNFIPSTNLTLNNTHISHYSRTQRLVQSVDMGCVGSGELSMFRYHMNVENMVIQYTFPGNANRYNTNDTTGLLLGSRTSSTYATLFDRGIKQSTITSTSTGTLPNTKMHIGNMNPQYLPSANQCAFASIGDGLNDTQALDLYNIVQTFQTTLSRQV
jgi:hypothetical protein